MPEVITKYPDVLLKILKDANIACGEGKPQTILKQCPKDQFCSLPTGELCVYGVKQAASMTQLSPLEFLISPGFLLYFTGVLIFAFLGGIMAGIYIQK